MTSDSSAPSSVSRAVLVIGVAITAVSFLALLLILGLYFGEIIPHASLYWITLWGFPIGFALMCIYVMLQLNRRRRTARLT